MLFSPCAERQSLVSLDPNTLQCRAGVFLLGSQFLEVPAYDLGNPGKLTI